MQVLYDHSDFFIIAKPQGVTMHEASNGLPAVLPLFKAALAKMAYPEAQYAHLHLVHRLDDHTSGCLIIAKHAVAAERFRELFSQQRIQKYYVALSHAKGKRKAGWVKGDMVNKRKGQWVLTKSVERPAISYFFRQGLGNGLYLFWVKPFSGKTHQVRVALKSNGSGILGDTQYSSEPAQRMYLHAFALDFMYEDEPIQIHCPVDHIEPHENDTDSWFHDPHIINAITPDIMHSFNWPLQP